MDTIQMQDIIASSDQLQKQQGAQGLIQARSWESLCRIYGCLNETDAVSQSDSGFVMQFQLLKFPDGKSSMKTINSALPAQPGKLLESITEDGNIYIMRNICRKKYGSKKNNVLGISSLVVDLDAHKIDVEQANAIGRVCAHTLQQEVNAGIFRGMEPMSIHFTGRGVQIIWRIQTLQPDSTSEAQHDRVAVLLCQFIEEWLNRHAPLNILDIDRPVSKNMGGLIRMPGSFNQTATLALGRAKAQSVPYNPTAKRIHTIDDLEQAVCNALHITPKECVDTESATEEKTGKSTRGTSKKSGKTIRRKRNQPLDEPLPLDEKPSDIYTSHLSYQEQLKILKTRMSLYEREQRYYAVFNMLKEKYPEGKRIPVGMRDHVIYILGNLLLQFESIRETKARLCGISKTMFQTPFTANEIESCMSTSFRAKNNYGTRGYILTNRCICEKLELNLNHFPRIIDFKKQNSITRLNKFIKQEKLDKARALRASGLTYAEVAKEMNVSERTISRWMKQTSENTTNENTIQPAPWKPVILDVATRAKNIVQMGIDIFYGKKQKEDFAEEDHELLRRTDKILFKIRSPLYDEYVKAGTRGDEHIRKMILIDLLYPVDSNNTQPTIETCMKPVIVPVRIKVLEIMETSRRIRKGELPNNALPEEDRALLQRANDIYYGITSPEQRSEYIQFGCKTKNDVIRMILIDLLYPVYANPQTVASDNAQSTVQTAPVEMTDAKDNKPEQNQTPVCANKEQSQMTDTVTSHDMESATAAQTVSAPLSIIQTLSEEELAQMRLEAIAENEEESLSYIVPEHGWKNPDDYDEEWDRRWETPQDEENYDFDEQTEVTSTDTETSEQQNKPDDTEISPAVSAQTKAADTEELERNHQYNMEETPISIEDSPAVALSVPTNVETVHTGAVSRNRTYTNCRAGKILVALHPLLLLRGTRNPKPVSGLCKSAGTICAEKPPQSAFVKNLLFKN